MVHIQCSPNILRHLQNHGPWEIHLPGTAATLGDVLETLFVNTPQLRGYILDDQNTVRKHVAVFINDTLIADRTSLSDPVHEHDTIFIAQALSGG